MSKKLLVTGSLAYDRIAVFRDRFSAHILPDKIHRLNVSFSVEQMTVELGGTAGNIAYSLALLGEPPVLLGAVGEDFDLYESCLKKSKIKTDYLKRIPGVLTSQATVMTDLDDNQIAAFYEGAGARAHESKIEAVKEKIALAILAPGSRVAILEYAEACRTHPIPFIADPGQAIPIFSAEDLSQLLRGAVGLIANDYEWQLIQDKTGLTAADLLKNLEWIIVTYAEKGSALLTREKEFKIPAYPVQKLVDPTGCGDAYRAGLMVGILKGYSLEKSAHMGAYLGARAVECRGTQNHTLDLKAWNQLIKTLQ